MEVGIKDIVGEIIKIRTYIEGMKQFSGKIGILSSLTKKIDHTRQFKTSPNTLTLFLKESQKLKDYADEAYNQKYGEKE